jgi:hypothetical protein
MRTVRFIACGIYVAYLLAALAVPGTMYVRRYLLQFDNFAEWAVVQMLPSMYTTEILITDLETGKKSSVPHHPARMFWLMRETPACHAYNINVVYRNWHGNRDYLMCGNTLIFDRRRP